ncbi:MAG: hypothetical protein EZS28_010543 [Streblomastix strix]|uniref:Uncharacterized protein n=1 Tax=Streblomastix strix TaxID=222440 RepID=A0A5J4WG67_9EUKA|nr:MAG: hypothetical protein EZS28_010543 [Streblomastix strix]
MGFFSGLKNFGSKILTGIKKAGSLLDPTIHKVMGVLSGPVSSIHPGIDAVMGTAGNIVGKERNASDYEVFKIFETLIDDKELDDYQQQFYDQKKQEFDERFGMISDRTQEIIGYLHYLDSLALAS